MVAERVKKRNKRIDLKTGKEYFMNSRTIIGMACAATLMSASMAFAALPKATEILPKMGLGFNIGNSMDVPNNPTAWGNPFPTQDLMDSIKAAGFNTVRIPCAWDSHAPNGVITDTWLDSVKTVVDYAMRAGLYTILNIHHEGEGGWFQTHIGTSVDQGVNTKLKNYWTQIANKFKTYNERLIFAGANEPGSNVGDQSITQQHVNTLMSYYQTFVDAVRATGGNNETRTLVIQGPNTNIDNSIKFVTMDLMPKDKSTGYIMFEVHYYDPYQYTLMYEQQNWGADEPIIPQYYYGASFLGTDSKRNAGYNAWAKSVDMSYANGEHTKEQFAKMNTNFVKNGYPVIVGEFGANIRTPDLSGDNLNKHKQGRILWHKDVVQAAKNNGICPILWDMGNENGQYDNMAYIRRQTQYGKVGTVIEVDVINAMREVYGLGKYENKGVTHTEDFTTIGSDDTPTNPESSAAVPESSNSQPNSSGNKTTCKAFTTECYSEAELCQMGIAQFCNAASSSSAVQSSATVATSSEANSKTALHNAQIANVTLFREGNTLRASASIKLFDINGNLISTANVSGGKAIMQLENLRQGFYIAQSGHKTLKINIK